MVSVTAVLFYIVLALVLIYKSLVHRRKKLLPPGPYPLPIIGNLYNIIQDGGVLEFYKRQQEKYGDVSYYYSY